MMEGHSHKDNVSLLCIVNLSIYCTYTFCRRQTWSPPNPRILSSFSTVLLFGFQVLVACSGAYSNSTFCGVVLSWPLHQLQHFRILTLEPSLFSSCKLLLAAPYYYYKIRGDHDSMDAEKRWLGRRRFGGCDAAVLRRVNASRVLWRQWPVSPEVFYG